MCRIIYNMVVLVCWVTVGQTMTFTCRKIRVLGAINHAAYNGSYIKTSHQCRDGDTYRQNNGDGLLVQRSVADGWAVVANPQKEKCPTPSDSNIRLIGRDEVDIPSLVLSVWSEFVDQKVTLNNKLVVECDDTFAHVTCTNASISSRQVCPLGCKIKITKAHHFTDGTLKEQQTCNASDTVCSSKLKSNSKELKSLKSYCDGRRACLPWVVPSVRHKNCSRNSNVLCDEMADIMDGLVMAFQCKRNRGCKDLRLVNTTYHSHFPSNYSQMKGVMCNERNVYSNGDYYLWYSTLNGVNEGWYFGQQTSSSGFQCDGLTGTVATNEQLQYPEDATVWYEDPNRQDFQPTAAKVVCEDRPLIKYPDPCSPSTTAASSTTTVAAVHLTTTYPITTEEDSITVTADDNTMTSKDATHTSQQMEADNSGILPIYTTTIYNDKSELAKPNVAVIAGAAAGGGGVVIIVVIIVAVLIIRRRKTKADPETHDQEMVRSDTHDIGMEPGYAEVSPIGIVLESKTAETKLRSKLKGKKVEESSDKEQDSRTDKKTKKKKNMEDHVPNGQMKNEQTGAESPNDLYAVVNKPKKIVTQSEDDFGGDNDDVVIENTLYGQSDEDDVIGQPNHLTIKTAGAVENGMNDSGVQLDPDDRELDIEPCYAEVRNQSPVLNTGSVLTTTEKDKPTPTKGIFKNLFRKADKPAKQVEGKHENDAKINDSDTEVGPQGDVYAVVQKPVKKQAEIKTKPPVDGDEDDVMVENSMYGAMEENVTPEAPWKQKGSKRNVVTMYADDVHATNEEDQEVDDS